MRHMLLFKTEIKCNHMLWTYENNQRKKYINISKMEIPVKQKMVPQRQRLAIIAAVIFLSCNMLPVKTIVPKRYHKKKPEN